MSDWQGYVRDIADRIGLRDWTFKIEDRPAHEDADASIRPIYGQRRAQVWLGADIDDHDPEKQRGIIVHELLHCHTASIPAGYRHVETHLGPPVYGLLDSVMTDAEEQAIDAIAVVLAPFLPLPPVADDEQEAA